MNGVLKGALAAAAVLAGAAAFAEGEQKAVDDLEAKIRDLESRIAASDARAESAQAKAKDLNAKADEFRRTAGERSRTFNDENARANRERQRFDNNVRAVNNITRQIADQTNRMNERRNDVLRLEDVRKHNVNDEQVNKLRNATQAQKDIQARIDILRKILEQEEPELQKLVHPDRQENELVERNAAEMKMVDAFELAKEIETAITESYKDIKATQTAIERKMSFEDAQKITDVAKAVRIEANREVIESSPRTKEALDAQKVAQTEVIREADTIVETVVAMMEEAMEIVKPDDAADEHRQHSRQIKWMDEDDFAKRDREEERRKRLEELSEAADYAVAITQAAAEDENARAKDLTRVTEDADEIKKNMAVADAMEKQEQHLQSVGQLAKLSRSMPELLPGNVLRFGAEGRGGLPAKWAYVNSWYVIGPFPNPNRVNLRRKFPPESVIDLDATYVGKDGKVIRWVYEQAKSSRLPKETWRADDRAEIVPASAEEYGIWYAYAEVVSDVDCDRWIAVGSDDRSDVWVNDIPVWGSSNKLKTWNISEGYRKIHLNRGRNRILARIENGWNALGWSMCISVEDGDLQQ